MRCGYGRWMVGILGALALLLTIGASRSFAQSGIITSTAGGGANPAAATSAYLPFPTSVALDSSGNLYVAVGAIDEVAKIAPSGNLTVVAGTGYAGYSGDNGPATSATLNLANIYIGVAPSIALDGSGNLYIADDLNNVIRRVNLATGIITTIAGNGSAGYSGDGGAATSAELSFPMGIAVDSSGNLYIADDGNNVIRRVDASTGIITTVAGNGNGGYCGDGGAATSACLNGPIGVALDGSGDLYIADASNNVIRRVDGSTGTIATVAGNPSMGGSYAGDGGPATDAGMNDPSAVLVDASGNLFIADSGNEVIRRVDASTQVISTYAGNGSAGFGGDGGPATSASLNLGVNADLAQVGTLAMDSAGDLYIPDAWNSRVRMVNASTKDISTVGGGGAGGDGGTASAAILGLPSALAVDGAGDVFLRNDSDGRIRRIDAGTGMITTVAGNGIPIFFDPSPGDGGPATSANLSPGRAIALDASGNLFISDKFDNRIRRVDASTGTISTVAGNGGYGGYCGDGGPAIDACLFEPDGVAVDSAGNLYIADWLNYRVRKVDAASGTITTIAGNGTQGCTGDGGPATNAELGGPQTIAVDGSGNVYIDDCNDIRRIDAQTGIITTVAGNGTSIYSGDGGPATEAAVGLAAGLLVDAQGDIFIADSQFNRVRRVDAFSGIITTIAGSGSAAFAGGTFSGDGQLATNATLDGPYSVAFDASGNLLIADLGDNRIRKVALPPFVGFQPIALSFVNQVLGVSSTQTFTLKSTGTTELSIYNMSISGANAGDFSVTGTTCGSTLLSSQTCTVSVTYTPTVLGAESATLNVPTDAISSPQNVSLAGTSIEPTSSTTVSASANPSVVNQPITFTATVAASASSSLVPTGSVTFRDGATTLAAVSLNGAGQATFATSALGLGTHTIYAEYGGDSNFTASVSSVTQRVSYAICALYDQTRSVSSGAVFPIKVSLCDANGADLSSSGIVLHATAVTLVSNVVGVPESPGNANPDSDFRYDSTLGATGGYIFNLSTSGLATGTYSLEFTVTGDPVTHSVSFGVD